MERSVDVDLTAPSPQQRNVQESHTGRDSLEEVTEDTENVIYMKKPSAPVADDEDESAASEKTNQFHIRTPVKVLPSKMHRVRSCTFSSEWMAVAVDDGGVRVWSTKRFSESGLTSWDQPIILQHESPVQASIFSSNARYLYTATKDACIAAWKVPPANEINKFEGEYQVVMNQKIRLEIGMADLQRRLIKIHEELKTAKAYAADRLRSERQRCRFQLAMTQKIYKEEALPRSNELKEIMDEWEKAIKDPWMMLMRFGGRGHFGSIEDISVSENNRWLATASNDGTAVVWELNDDAPTQFKSQHKLLGHVDTVRSVSFNGDSDRLCTVSHDGTARIWGLNTGEGDLGENELLSWTEIILLRDHGAETTCCCFSPWDSFYLATACKDGKVFLYNTDSKARHEAADGRRRLASSRGHDSTSSTPVDNRKQSLLAETSYLDSFYNDISDEEGSLSDTSDSYRELFNERIEIRARLKYEADSLREGFFRSWDDLTSMERTGLIKEEESSDKTDEYDKWEAFYRSKWEKIDKRNSLRSVSPDGWIKTSDNIAKHRTVHGRRSQSPLSDNRSTISSLVSNIGRNISPTIGSVAEAGKHKLHRHTPAAIDRVKSYGPSPTAPMISPSSESWSMHIALRAHDRAIYCCAFSKDGYNFFTASADSEVRLWNTTDWTIRCTIHTHRSSSSVQPSEPVEKKAKLSVFSIAKSPDNKWLSTCLWDGTLQVWDTSRVAIVAKEGKKAPTKAFRQSKYSSPGFSKPVLPPRPKTSEKKDIPADKKQGRANSPKRKSDAERGNSNQIIYGRLSFLQVTQAFHQASMPFSAQCYGYDGKRGYDKLLKSPVKSEEIGADWSDVFQRLKVVPLQYNFPQVSPRFQKFFDPYVPTAQKDGSEEGYLPDILRSRNATPSVHSDAVSVHVRRRPTSTSPPDSYPSTPSAAGGPSQVEAPALPEMPRSRTSSFSSHGDVGSLPLRRRAGSSSLEHVPTPIQI